MRIGGVLTGAGLLKTNRWIVGFREALRVTVATAGQERRRNAESDQREGSPADGSRASNGSEEALSAPSQRLFRRGRPEDDARRRDIAIFLRRLRGELSGSGGEITRPLSWLHPKTVLGILGKTLEKMDGHDLGSPTPAQRVLSR